MNNSTSPHTKFLSVLAGLLFLAANTSFAALVKVDFSGTTLNADPGNSLGLSVGDAVTGWTIYDDALLTGTGNEFIGLGTTGTGFGGSLMMNMGLVSFNEFDDGDFLNFSFPLLEFLDGALVGFDFLVNDSGDTFEVSGTNWAVFNSENVGGVWDTFSSPVAVAVPEPSTLLLFGLVGLGLLGRRKNNTQSKS